MVILSVRLSVTTWYRFKTKWDWDFEFSPYDSLMSLVFRDKIHVVGWKGPLTRERKRGTHLKRRTSTVIGSSNVKMVADRQRHAAYHNKHWRRASLECQHRWPWMTSSPPPLGAFSELFTISGCDTLFKSELRQRWLEIDQDNLCIKFLVLNVDFSSQSPDSLRSRKPAYACVREC